MAENIERGTCKVCHQYRPTQAAMLRHRKGHPKVLIVIKEETGVGAEEEELTDEEESSTSDKMKCNVLRCQPSKFLGCTQKALVEDDTA